MRSGSGVANDGRLHQGCRICEKRYYRGMKQFIETFKIGQYISREKLLIKLQSDIG